MIKFIVYVILAAAGCFLASYAVPYQLVAAVCLTVLILVTWFFYGSRTGRRQPDRAGRPGAFQTEVVGESYYQEELEQICGGYTEEGHNFSTSALLVMEDDNRHDEKAVRVEIDGIAVGHLSRPDARRFRRISASRTLEVPAKIVGGWKRGRGNTGFFGVRLDVDLRT